MRDEKPRSEFIQEKPIKSSHQYDSVHQSCDGKVAVKVISEAVFVAEVELEVDTPL